jgi:aspartyl-tRNA(Asn)/glutamyl-tRNA(Gln) amidotransferase subunit A
LQEQVQVSFPRFPDWARLSAKSHLQSAGNAAAYARQLEPRLQAFVTIEEACVRQPQSGPLALLPYAAKDMFAAPNRRPSGGLAAVIDHAFGGHADVLTRLDEAGACRIGFTAMTELAYEPSGYNASAAYARNPWDLDFIPGGSSSGSAVAVASGTAVVALGSDTGGSIRIPAHCTGITGWKPTWGAVSAAGALPLAPFLDTIGLLARSAADLAGAAAVLTGDARPGTAIERVVVFGDALDAAELPVRSACRDGIDALQGCSISVSAASGLPAIETIDAHALRVMQGEAARTHVELLHSPAINATLRKRLEKGLTIGDAALAVSRAARASLAVDFEANVLGRADAAVLPVMPICTPPYREVDPASTSFSGRRLYALSNYCRFVNMLGFPAVAIPVGFDDRGLPVGLQIIGRPGRDGDLIDLAMRVQSKTDWHGRIPTAVRDLVKSQQGLFA